MFHAFAVAGERDEEMATVLITGTSTGIGLATAVQLARAGHEVFASMRHPDASPELGEIVAAGGLPVSLVQLDVDSDDSVSNAVSEILAARGNIDVLVNNAGIGWVGPIEEKPLSEFRQVMETNFFGALRCIQAVLPSMRMQRSGCIINVTSVAGRIATAPQAAYTASKHALKAISEVLAQEVKAFDIRVAIVEPGIIQTPIFSKMQEISPDTLYPHERRLEALFAKSNEDPVSPYVVAEKIEEIIASDSSQLRYPVGPDAQPFLEWRRSMSDEEWVDWAAQEDEAWCESVRRDFGLDVQLTD